MHTNYIKYHIEINRSPELYACEGVCSILTSYGVEGIQLITTWSKNTYTQIFIALTQYSNIVTGKTSLGVYMYIRRSPIYLVTP